MRKFLVLLAAVFMLGTVIPQDVCAQSKKEKKEMKMRADYMTPEGHCIPLFKGKPAKEFIKWAYYRMHDKWVYNENFKGKAVVSWVIAEDGTLQDFEFVQSSGNVKMDKIIKEVFTSSPQWLPKLNSGVPVSHKFTLPLSLQMRKKQNTSTTSSQPRRR